MCIATDVEELSISCCVFRKDGRPLIQPHNARGGSRVAVSVVANDFMRWLGRMNLYNLALRLGRRYWLTGYRQTF